MFRYRRFKRKIKIIQFIARLIDRSTHVRAGEGQALFLSAAYYFLLMCAYYILRPIRDNMGAAGGVDNLAWLFLGTLTGMMLLHPIYGALVSKLPRRQFVPLIYRFFIANLVIFYAVFQMIDPANTIWAGRVFFVWVSVFNLFVVSVFWSFMNDIYRSSQSKRLFGIVAVGGTAGGILGSSITSFLSLALSPTTLMLVSAVLLEGAAQVSKRLGKSEEGLALTALREEGNGSNTPHTEEDANRVSASVNAKHHEVIGGGPIEGIRHLFDSPYLLGIAVLIMLYSLVSTFLYFQQIAIVNEVLGNNDSARTQLFASRDLVANIITLVVQIFFTGRILRWFGVGTALAFLPVVSFIGFGILSTAPILIVVIVFDALRRVSNFAIQRPARETLYTVLSRNEKYKAKNFNDTFIYRLGDQVGAWSYTFMLWLGFSLSGLALSMLPISALWLVLALWLGRFREKESEWQEEDVSATDLDHSDLLASEVTEGV